jgi:hypothetical protein
MRPAPAPAVPSRSGAPTGACLSQMRLVDPGRVESLVQGFSSYSGAAAGGGLRGTKQGPEAIEAAVEQVLELLLVEQPTPLQVCQPATPMHPRTAHTAAREPPHACACTCSPRPASGRGRAARARD